MTPSHEQQLQARPFMAGWLTEDQNQQELGWSVLDTLVASTLASKDDQRIVQIMSVHVALAKLSQEDDDERTEPAGGSR